MPDYEQLDLEGKPKKIQNFEYNKFFLKRENSIIKDNFLHK